MNRLKRFLLLLCALALLFSLAACGDEEAAVSEESSDLVEESALSSAVSSEIVSEASEISEVSEVSAVSEIEDELIEVRLAVDAQVYSERGESETIETLSADALAKVEDIGDTFWFAYKTAAGSTGYLYGENLFPVSEDGEAGAESLTAMKVNETLSELEKKLPDGKYWNHMGKESGGEFTYTDTPCRHAAYGDFYCNKYNGSMLEIFPAGYLNQCMGFACLLSDETFGAEAPLIKFYDFSKLKKGDMIRFREYEHSMIVLDIGENEVTLAEANENYEDCLISWTTVMTRQKLVNSLGWDSIYVSRYPMLADENGVYRFRTSEGGNLMRNRRPANNHTGTAGNTGSESASSESSAPENPESSGGTEPSAPESTEPPAPEITPPASTESAAPETPPVQTEPEPPVEENTGAAESE